jgi:V/A-type H+/Na+-transporting ATPase subunit E
MTELEKADFRIQEICEKIRSETLDPAKEEASAIVDRAKIEAEQIITAAKLKAEEQLILLQQRLEQERQVFTSSLEQACRQTQEQLKLKIEERFFNPALANWVEEQLGQEQSHAKLIDVLVEALHKEGIRSELSVIVPKKFSAAKINAELSEQVLKSLKNHSVELSDIGAGVRVKVADKHMMLDISAKALEDLVSSFIRKEFRNVFFNG